eukprot:gnl/TRDRNA2_/TRDRNA2_170395_c1_seq2.p2 gnl/TRDRNA2_/TRDRNA2_170395_c1~~gnl/TRDRNA2_/TRDRNA2_170395_c1_seq2.p2  ORF type:complete len:205 (+),score=29.97 gnl/TRDRNA2_/TRDRNA2_170395_c1_seq2:170-784(+)
MGAQSSSGIQCCTPRHRGDDSDASRRENVQIQQIGEILEEGPQEKTEVDASQVESSYPAASSSVETSQSGTLMSPCQPGDFVRWETRMAYVDDVFHEAEGPPVYQIRLLVNDRTVRVSRDAITKMPVQTKKQDKGDFMECCTPRRRGNDSELSNTENVQIGQIAAILQEGPEENHKKRTSEDKESVRDCYRKGKQEQQGARAEC